MKKHKKERINRSIFADEYNMTIIIRQSNTSNCSPSRNSGISSSSSSTSRLPPYRQAFRCPRRPHPNGAIVKKRFLRRRVYKHKFFKHFVVVGQLVDAAYLKFLQKLVRSAVKKRSADGFFPSHSLDKPCFQKTGKRVFGVLVASHFVDFKTRDRLLVSNCRKHFEKSFCKLFLAQWSQHVRNRIAVLGI